MSEGMDPRTHVGHAASDAGERPALRIVHGNVEVGDMCMASFVEEDVVGLKVTMDDFLLVEESDCAGKLGHVKSYGVLREEAQSFEMNCGFLGRCPINKGILLTS